MLVGQPAFLSRRQSREAHFAHSRESICSGDQLLLLCLCHLSHCTLTLAEPVGEKLREGKITGCLLQTARAGRQRSCGRSLEERSGMHVTQTRGKIPLLPQTTLACFAFISTPLPAALSLLLPEPLVHSHRICLAGKGTHRIRICKDTLGMSQPHTSLLPLPKLYKPGPYPQEGSESLMQSSGWQELGVQTGNIPAEEEK